MGILDKLKKKSIEGNEDTTCDICGNTFKSYKNSKHKNVCEKCFSNINED